MLDADMDTLLNDAAIDELVDTDTYGALGDVKDDSGPAVVTLVRHTLVDGGVGKDVDIVSDLDVHQVLRQMNRSVLTELLGKHVARTRSCSERVRHLCCCCCCCLIIRTRGVEGMRKFMCFLCVDASS